MTGTWHSPSSYSCYFGVDRWTLQSPVRQSEPPKGNGCSFSSHLPSAEKVLVGTRDSAPQTRPFPLGGCGREDSWGRRRRLGGCAGACSFGRNKVEKNLCTPSTSCAPSTESPALRPLGGSNSGLDPGASPALETRGSEPGTLTNESLDP